MGREGRRGEVVVGAYLQSKKNKPGHAVNPGRGEGEKMSKFVADTSKKQVEKDYPGAAIIIRVVGGYMVFDTIAEFEIWEKQK